VAEIDVRGTRFHYVRLGGGERTVVFVHGLIMDDLSSWYFTLANPVAKHADVLVYDLRGHGKSERTPTGYRVADMVDDLAGLLDGLGLEDRPVDLVGNSYGGLLAVAFAVAHPERMRSLVLVDAHIPDEEWVARMQHTLQLEGEERDRLIMQSFRKWIGRHSEVKRTRLAERARALVEGTSLVRDIGAGPRFGDEELASIRCPVLALYGGESDMRDRGERMERTLPHCTLELFPACTHSIIWEAGSALRDRIVSWVRTPPPSTGSPGTG
jgi:pimeloyl-ACP methyl ester carboxylesterase